MKRSNQLLIGLIVGLIQYFFITGVSYLMVIWNFSVSLESAMFLLFHILVVSIAVGNILFKISSFGTLILRVGSSILSYIFTMLIFARLGIITKLEQLLAIGSSAANLQGLLSLSLIFWAFVVSALMFILKCVSIRQETRLEQNDIAQE